jgi:diketogulonate reductase-like aldo/keto reductase
MPMKPYFQRYHLKSKYLQTEAFKPLSLYSVITNSNKKIFKSTYITRIKQHANEQRNQLLLNSFVP